MIANYDIVTSAEGEFCGSQTYTQNEQWIGQQNSQLVNPHYTLKYSSPELDNSTLAVFKTVAEAKPVERSPCVEQCQWIDFSGRKFCGFPGLGTAFHNVVANKVITRLEVVFENAGVGSLSQYSLKSRASELLEFSYAAGKVKLAQEIIFRRNGDNDGVVELRGSAPPIQLLSYKDEEGEVLCQ